MVRSPKALAAPGLVVLLCALCLSLCPANVLAQVRQGGRKITPYAKGCPINPEECSSPGVQVTPDGAMPADPIAGSQNLSLDFTIYNPAANYDDYTLGCSQTGSVQNCSVSQGSVTVNGGSLAYITVYYSAGAAGAGTLTLTATSTINAGISDDGYYAIQVDSYGASVIPKGQATSRGWNGAYRDVFTIQNTGSTPNTYSLTAICSGNVACPNNPISRTSLTLGAGASDTASVPYSTGNSGTGTVLVRATGTGNAADSGSYSVTILFAGVTVTPDGQTTADVPENSGSYGQRFQVQNVGNTTQTFTYSCHGSSGVTCSGTPVPAASTLAAGQRDSFVVSWTVGAPGTGHLEVEASGGGALDSGYVNVPIIHYAVAVDPDGQPAQATWHGVGFVANFTVRNTGTGADTYRLTCSSTAVLQCTTTSPWYVSVNAQGSLAVPVTYSAPGLGAGTLWLTAVSTNGTASDSGSFAVNVIDATPPTLGIISTSGAPVSVAPESGPYQYSVTVQNNGGTNPGTYDVQCVTLFPQLPCESPSPTPFTLGGGGATQQVVVPYHAKGLGAFQQKIRITLETDPPKVDSVTVGPITVTGIPIVQHQNPPDGADFGTADTLRVTYDHPSGIDTANVRVFLNGQPRTDAAIHKTLTGYTAAASGLGLAGGHYRWTTYACAVNGRCDSVSTSFQVTAPANYALDDSLPPTTDPLGSGTLLGPLPLPEVSERGCAQDQGDPEITFTAPVSYLTQSAPNGRIFVATIDTSSLTLTASTQSLAWLPNRSQTCGQLSYLNRSQFDYSFFASNPPDDPHWLSYPYGDLAVRMERPLPWELGEGSTELAFGGPNAVRGPNAGSPWSAGWRTLAEKGHPVIVDRTAAATEGSTASSFARAASRGGRALVPDAGPIDPSSYQLVLNGVVLVDHGSAAVGGVTVTRLTTLNQDVAISITGVSALNIQAQGGWNELVATISDSSGHTTTTRTRFVYDASSQAGPVQPLAVTPLRDFTHLDQGECAAFGAFQCDGVMLTATIPGFVTRDRDRSLHLVYRSGSQRQPSLIPLKLFVAKAQKAPDSLWVTPAISGVLDTTRRNRYAGAIGTVTGANATRINESRDEERIVGLEVPAPSSGGAAIRKVTHWVRSWFVPAVGTTFRDDSVSQDVVQLYLSDTLSTRFGQGWQLAELGRLVLGQTFRGDTAAIWLSGDGSYSIFRKPGGAWLSPPGENSRLVTLPAGQPDSGAQYVLYPDNGASIGFRSDGWQVWTRDLLGNATKFYYNGSTTSRIDSIADPAGKKIVFQYFTTGKRKGTAKSVYLRFSSTASDTATVAYFDYDTVSSTSAARLRKVAIRRSSTATDTVVTRFSYFGGSAPGAFVDSVIDPRDSVGKRVVTRFTYDPLLWTPETVTRPLGGVASIRLPWRRAVPRVGYGRVSGGNALERTIQSVQYVGTSVPFAGTPTDFTVDAFGGPTMVRHFATDPSVAGNAGDDIRHIVTDTAGRPIRIVRNRYSPSKADSVVYHYDALGRVDSLIRSTLEYQASGQTRGLDTLAFTYDSVTLVSGQTWCSRLLTSRDPLGRATAFQYGTSGVGRCLPLRVVGIASDTTLFTYGPLTKGNVAGVRPLSTTDPNGLKDSVAYHAGTWNSEYLVRVRDQAVTRAFYDRFGRPDSVVDPVGVRTWFIRDRLGRVTFQKTGLGSLAPATHTAYDKGGLVTQVDVYSAADNLSAITTVPGSAQTTRSYFNELGWLDSTVTPGGRAVASNGYQARKQSYGTFDGFGNPRWEHSGNGSYVSRVYDWQGRVSSMELSLVRPGFSTDGERFADNTTTNWWNSLNLPTGRVQSAGQKHTFAYDAKGQLVADSSFDQFLGASNPVSGATPYASRRFGYSRTGQLVADTLTLSGGATVVRRFEYNLLGQRTLVSDTVFAAGLTSSPERAGQIQYSYDPTTSRLSSVTGSSGGAMYARVRLAYDRGGRDTLKAVLLGGVTVQNAEVITRIGYDSVGRLASQSSANSAGWNGGNTWYSLTGPSYSSADELLGFSSVEPGDKSGSHAFTYTTDGTRRLLSAAEGLTSGTWTYDVMGNRLTEWRTSSVANDPCKGSRSLSYGADNRLMYRTAVPGQNDCHLSRYWADQNGNRLGESDTTVAAGNPPIFGLASLSSYTAANQLYFSVTPAGVGAWDFNWNWYDAQGRRVMSQMGTGNQLYPVPHPDSISANRTFYVYDGSDVALVLLRSGGTWSVDSRLLVGGVDQPLTGRFQMSGNYKNLALVGDRNGTLVQAVRTDGTQENDAAYVRRDAYGALTGLVSTGQQPQPLAGAGYAGAGTPNSRGGFVYLRNRWYDPETGRFLTQDPIGLAGGVNLYAYAGNNPIGFSDPFGLDCTLKDRSTCQFLKVTGSIGLLPAEARFKVGVAESKASIGFTAAATAEASWGANGIATSGKLSVGASVDAKATVAGYGGSANAACSMTTNRTGGCKGGFKVEAADATFSSKGSLAVGGSIGIAKGEIEVNVVDYIVSSVGQLLDAAKDFLFTLNEVKAATSEAPLITGAR